MESPHLHGWRTYSFNASGEEYGFDHDIIGLKLLLANEEGSDEDMFETKIIWVGKDTLQGHVQRDRVKVFTDAVCRFLNAGGHSQEITELLSGIRDLTKDVQVIPDGSIISVDEQVDFGILYQLKENRYLRVVQDDFSERMSSKQVAEMFNLSKEEVEDAYI